MAVLWGILLSSVASALIPLINIEAILVLARSQSDHTILVLCLVGAAGQMIGKILWYWGGMNMERASWVQRYLKKPKAHASLEKWKERADGRPWFTGGLLFISAWTGFPPYAVTAVLAGIIRVRMSVFLITGFVGRALRFWTVLGGVDLLLSWF